MAPLPPSGRRQAGRRRARLATAWAGVAGVATTALFAGAASITSASASTPTSPSTTSTTATTPTTAPVAPLSRFDDDNDRDSRLRRTYSPPQTVVPLAPPTTAIQPSGGRRGRTTSGTS